MTSAWQYSIEVTVTRRAVQTARRELASALQTSSIAEELRADVVLLAAALIRNAVQHELADTINLDVAVNDAGAVTVTMAGRRGSNTTVWFTVGDGADRVRPLDTTEPSVSAAEQAAIIAAGRTADTAREAQVVRATAALEAAAAVADAAARAVDAVQAQADQLALAVSAAAADAALRVSTSIAPGGDAAAARAARDIGALVLSTAAAKAEETAQAAILVARAVAAAAAAVASTTAATAAAIEHDVLDAALAVQAVTAATARDRAAASVERSAAVALANRAALAASEAASQRLEAANQQLRRAGAHDHAIALALQEAMLTQLPAPKDLLLAARYLTAAEQSQVGGDWYDAVALPNGGTALVIGDVIGHDIQAAATMGQLRNILRAQLLQRSDPSSDVVGRLDRAIRDLHIDTIASLILGIVEPPSADEPGSVATLRWSNAGHPAPVLIHVDGTAVQLDESTDILLGVEPDSIRSDHTQSIPAGATLLLYTDGLIETRTDSIDVGLNRLLETVHAHYHREPGAMLDAVLSDMVGDQPGDDVAVLAVRFMSRQSRGDG